VSPVSPSRDEFRTLARAHRVVPVWRHLLADFTTPVAAFARLVGDGDGFLLESVERERWSRWSFIGRNPLASLTLRDGRVHVTGDVPASMPTDQGLLAALEHLLAIYQSPQIAELPPLHAGLIGYLGYDIVREVEHLPHVNRDDVGAPDAVMSIIGDLAAYDHWRQRVTLVSNTLVAEASSDADLDVAYDQAVARLEQLAADGARPLDEPMFEPPTGDEPLPEVTSSMGKNLYCAAVEAAKECILAGDIFQVVLAQRFGFPLDADPFDFYRALRQVNPSPYMYFLRLPDLTLAGSSPEPMVKLDNGRVISRPIAGTRRRGTTEADDRRLASELQEDPKELAEHVMLIDLARNDVGRVVQFGTEQLDEKMVLERYSHVMHLTSQVSGQLAPGRTPIDVLRATLPAGTVSGAPKVRAMEIIDELEPVKRGAYAGTVGYIDFSGNIDTAIAIRTLMVRGNQAWVQAGAGIVVDSIPENEHLECENKARALLAAVPVARRMTAQRAAAHAVANRPVVNHASSAPEPSTPTVSGAAS
jgi:anthranilate synthase component 1